MDLMEQPQVWCRYPGGSIRLVSDESQANFMLNVHPEIYKRHIFFYAYASLSTEGI